MEHVLNIQNNVIKCVFKHGHYFEFVNILLKQEYFSNFEYFLKCIFWESRTIFKTTIWFWKFHTFSEIQKQNLKWEHFLKIPNFFKNNKKVSKTQCEQIFKTSKIFCVFYHILKNGAFFKISNHF